MIRILHLTPVCRDFQTRRCIEHLTHQLGDGFATVSGTIGLGGGDYHNLLEAILGSRGTPVGEADIVHAWSLTALATAAAAGCPRIIYSPSPELRPGHLRWVRAVLRYRKVELVFPTSTLRALYVQRGIPPAQCHVIRPGVDFARLEAGPNPVLRAALGFADSDYVILAPGESTRATAHEDALWAAAILNCMDSRYRLLIAGEGARSEALARFAGRLGQENLYTSARARLRAEVELESLTSAADAVLVTAHGALPTLPIAISMAAGLPIVAAVNPTICELLEDQRTALLTPRAKPRTLARRILDLREDETAQRQIAGAARDEAHRNFDLAHFMEQWRTTYRQLAREDRIEVSPRRSEADALAEVRG